MIQDDIVPDCTSHKNMVNQAVYVGQGDKARMLRLHDTRTLSHQGGYRDVEGAKQSPINISRVGSLSVVVAASMPRY